MFNKRKKAQKQQFMAWEDYEEMITTLELFSWQQATRRQSIKNTLVSSY